MVHSTQLVGIDTIIRTLFLSTVPWPATKSIRTENSPNYDRFSSFLIIKPSTEASERNISLARMRIATESMKNFNRTRIQKLRKSCVAVVMRLAFFYYDIPSSGKLPRCFKRTNEIAQLKQSKQLDDSESYLVIAHSPFVLFEASTGPAIEDIVPFIPKLFRLRS